MRKDNPQFAKKEAGIKKGDKYIKNEFWIYDNKRKKYFRKIYYQIIK